MEQHLFGLLGNAVQRMSLEGVRWCLHLLALGEWWASLGAGVGYEESDQERVSEGISPERTSPGPVARDIERI